MRSPFPSVWSLVVVTVTFGVMLTSLSGCSIAQAAPKQLDARHADITAPAKSKLEVHAGPENRAGGDHWQLTMVTPTGAVAALERRQRTAQDCPTAVVGCAEGDVYFALTLAADLPTWTTVRFKVENCWRGSCPTSGAVQTGAHGLIAYTVTITP